MVTSPVNKGEGGVSDYSCAGTFGKQRALLALAASAKFSFRADDSPADATGAAARVARTAALRIFFMMNAAAKRMAC